MLQSSEALTPVNSEVKNLEKYIHIHGGPSPHCKLWTKVVRTQQQCSTCLDLSDHSFSISFTFSCLPVKQWVN